ncbi:MAG: ABC transporter ATP-binding protein [Thermoproteota archaeon]|jgi:branched-chain amino acid transport system ATP-binding protein|nr:ABC transporter ATP-binding protein [Thermoproteota archaeon]
MLFLKEIEAGYGKLQVLWGVNLEIKEKEIVCLLGPNGAGKTTTLKVIAGFIRPYKGKILYKGKDITGLQPYERVKLGVTLVPETRELFPYMSVEENLLIGIENSRKKIESKEIIEKVFNLFPVLKEKKKQLAKTLSGGEQQMLAIARALASEPSLLILDEPSTGLAPKIVAKIFEILPKLRESGLTILLVEQSLRLALNIADRGYVMENGRIVIEGSAEELKNNEKIKSVYLGLY